MFNYKQLYYFWNVARYGGVTRASEQLHLTPQTISGQISELEASLETALFERSGRRLKLTDAGELAYSHADEIFQIGNELEALLKGYQEESELVFKVGVSDVVPKSIAYRLLSPAIHLDEPVKLHCHESKPELLFADLMLHKIDLILSDRPLPTDSGIKGFNHYLGESRMALFAKEHLAEELTDGFPQSLNGAPLLLPSSESAMRISIDRWLSKHQLHPWIRGEFDDTALMKAFAKEGLGVFPAPDVIAEEIETQHNVRKITALDDMSCRYYAISVQRKLSHPAVVAISESAQNMLIN